MTLIEADGKKSREARLTAGIFEVDGIMLASPPERAWRDALVL